METSVQARGVTTRAKTLLGLMQEVLGRHTRVLRFAGVVTILLFSFWAGMGPHWDYRYPLHVDEWFAQGFTQSMIESGSLQYPTPYGGEEISHHPEMGFHLLLAFLKTSTGLSWLGLYRVAPGVLVALLAFLVYALGRRDGFGWAAAIFVPLIPTSIRTLGPTFLVPVSAAMIFIPVTLMVLHRMEAVGRGQSLWLLLVLIGGTLFVHPPTEVVVTALAALYLAALGAEALVMRRYRRAMNLLVAVGIRMLVPIIVLGVWLPTPTLSTVERSVSSDPGIIRLLGFNLGFFEAFGGIAVVLFVWGLLTFVWHRPYGLLSYVLPAFTGFLYRVLQLHRPVRPH